MALNNPCQGSTVSGSSQDDYTADRGPSELPQAQVVDAGRAKCGGQRQVISIAQGQKTTFVLWATNVNGAALDLSQGGPFTCRLILRDREASIQERLNILGEVDTTDAAKGKINFSLADGQMKHCGIFPAQLSIYTATDELIHAQPFWYESRPGLDYRSWGPLTIAEIRMELRDACAEQNYLIDDLEFDDSQIAYCLRKPIDEFNERFQPKTNYSPKNFPHRFHWSRATVGYLLEIASRGYVRNHLDYAAGGVTVQDKNKFGAYAQMSAALLAEWRQFVKERKVELNIEGGFGNLGSGYNYSTYR